MLRSLFSAVGSVLRESGQALDRLGARLQGSYAFLEQLPRNARVLPYGGNTASIAPSAFVAPNASIIGNVRIADKASVWYGAVVRGDINQVTIGEGSNVQDRAVIHVSKMQRDLPTRIGARVTVESGALLHACTLEDDAFVGMGATVLDGAVVSTQSMIAPGSLVTMNTTVPAGQLWAGSPAKFVRDLTAEERANMSKAAAQVAELAVAHKAENDKSPDEILAEAESREWAEDRAEDYSSKMGHAH